LERQGNHQPKTINHQLNMARIIKSGLIQLSLAKTEGEGTIAEIKEAMLQNTYLILKKLENKVFKYYVFKKFLIHHIFAQDKIALGINQPKQSQDLPLI